MLQQPGVTVSGVANGNGKSGLSLFNNRSPGVKKKNWVHREAGAHTNTLQAQVYQRVPTCTHTRTYKHTSLKAVQPFLLTNSGWLWSHICITLPKLFIHTWIKCGQWTRCTTVHTSVAHSYSLMLWRRITVYTWTHSDTHWRAKVHLQSVFCLCLGSRLSRAVKQ